MKRAKEFLVYLLLLALVPVVVIAGEKSAHADPLPPMQWPSVALSDMPGAHHAVTHLDQSVTVGCPNGSAATTTAFKTFNAVGAVVQSRPFSYPRPDACVQRMAVGKDGTVYAFAHTSFSPLIQAYKDNQLIWEYNPNCGPYAYPLSMVVAPNDNLYMHFTQGVGNCSSDMLIGVTQAAQVGANTPAEVARTSLPWDMPAGGLAVYQDGLVVLRQSQIQYRTFGGTVQATYPHGWYGLSRWSFLDHFDATLAGRVFVANKASSNATTGCNYPDGVAGSITAFDPTGPAWTVPLAGCTEVYDLRPNYRGGVVMHGLWQQPLNQLLVNKLTAFSAAGDQLWAREYQREDAYSYTRIATDLNGNVAVRHYAQVTATINGSSYKFGEIRFSLLSGNTGNVIPGTDVVLRGNTTSPNGPSYRLVYSDIAIGKNATYVIAETCTDVWQCDSANPKLYAFTVPGLEIDYPRGAILRHNEPWKQYVAMGDSFSSGQGVKPYQPGTDVSGPPENRCRRSEQGAYSKLLDGNVAAHLTLTAFVACGGAETWHVINGSYGEESQLNVLSEDTDVVTITIGGNNIGFEPLVAACVTEFDCTQTPAYANAVTYLQEVLPSALNNLFAQMATRIGPHTRVLVIGYPLLIPEVNKPTTWPNCVYLQSNEKIAARQIINDLNQALYDGAGRAGPRFEYVDVNYLNSPFREHELCNDGSYFHGAVLPPGDSSDSFHPNAAGQEAYFQVVARYL